MPSERMTFHEMCEETVQLALPAFEEYVKGRFSLKYRRGQYRVDRIGKRDYNKEIGGSGEGTAPTSI
jgi:hypothetical protein